MITVDQASTEFILAAKSDGLAAPTIRWYRHMLRSLNTWFYGKPLQEVTTHALRQYIAMLRERPTRYQNASQRPVMLGGLSHESLRDHLRAYRRFFAWAWEEYDWPAHKNPILKIRMPPREKSEPKAIRMDDLIALLKACEDTPEGKRDRAILAFLADTGCRSDELLTLTIKNLHLGDHYAVVRGKGKRDRAVPFIEQTAVWLRAWLAVRPWEADERVFCGLRLGSEGAPLQHSGLSQILKRLKRRAGVMGRVNPHSFRHAFAREYLKNGGDLGTLSQLMGHSHVNVTVDHYAVFKDVELGQFHQKYSPMRGVKRE